MAALTGKRIRPVRWAANGMGYLEVLSSDNETWYSVMVGVDGNLMCHCIGFSTRAKCYHCDNAAQALEDGSLASEISSKGQAAFLQATENDWRRQNISAEKEDWTEGAGEEAEAPSTPKKPTLVDLFSV